MDKNIIDALNKYAINVKAKSNNPRAVAVVDRNVNIFTEVYDKVNNKTPITYKQLGEKYKLSQSRVRQISSKIRRILLHPNYAVNFELLRNWF